eukprot:2097056-Pleurochrysis_carterae.AAC.1
MVCGMWLQPIISIWPVMRGLSFVSFRYERSSGWVTCCDGSWCRGMRAEGCVILAARGFSARGA